MVREMMTMLDSVPSVRAVPTSPEACPMCASSTLVMIALVFGDANSAMPEPITSWTSVTTHSDDAPSREEASKRPTPHTAMPIVAMMSAPCLSAIRPPSGEINT